MHHSSPYEHTPDRHSPRPHNASGDEHPTRHSIDESSAIDPSPGGSLTTDQIEAWAASTLIGLTVGAITGPALVADPATTRPENNTGNVADNVTYDAPDESLLLAAHPSVTTTARHFVTGWAAHHRPPR